MQGSSCHDRLNFSEKLASNLKKAGRGSENDDHLPILVHNNIDNKNYFIRSLIHLVQLTCNIIILTTLQSEEISQKERTQLCGFFKGGPLNSSKNLTFTTWRMQGT